MWRSLAFPAHCGPLVGWSVWRLHGSFAVAVGEPSPPLFPLSILSPLSPLSPLSLAPAAVPMLVHSPVTHARSLARLLAPGRLRPLAQSVRADERGTDGRTDGRRRASVFFGTSCCSTTALLLPLLSSSLPSVVPSGLICVPLLTDSSFSGPFPSTQNRKPSSPYPDGPSMSILSPKPKLCSFACEK